MPLCADVPLVAVGAADDAVGPALAAVNVEVAAAPLVGVVTTEKVAAVAAQLKLVAATDSSDPNRRK